MAGTPSDASPPLGLPCPQTKWGISLKLGGEKATLIRVRKKVVSLLAATLAIGMKDLADRYHEAGRIAVKARKVRHHPEVLVVEREVLVIPVDRASFGLRLVIQRTVMTVGLGEDRVVSTMVSGFKTLCRGLDTTVFLLERWNSRSYLLSLKTKVGSRNVRLGIWSQNCSAKGQGAASHERWRLKAFSKSFS